MRDRHAFYRMILSILAIPFLFYGCSAKASGICRVEPDVSAGISRSVSETDRVVATAWIDLVTSQGHYPFRAALVMQKPSYFRLEVLPVIGTPDFFLAATPDDLSVWIPSQGEFYSGKPTASNLERFLNWGMNLDDIVSILTGSCPSFGGAQATYDAFQEGDLNRIEMKKPRGPSQTIWMNKNGLMAKLVRYDSAGREIYTVEYRYDGSRGYPPLELGIRFANLVTSMTLKYSDWKVEKAADRKIFELPVPEGARIISLD